MNATAQKFEPESELLSIAEIAKRLQLHRQTVKSRLDDLGYEPEQVNPDGPDAKLYRFDDEVHFAIKAAKSDLDAAKLRDARATYQLKELKLAEARRLMVPAHEVTEFSQKLGAAMYQELTVRQPKRIAAKLAKAKNVMAVKKIMKADTDRIFKSLRENFERFIA